MPGCTPNADPNNWQSSIRYLYLWGDDECPDVDTKRLLMAFLYMIGWKGGPLFPSRAEMKNPPPNGVYMTHLLEDDLYDVLEHIFKEVLKRKDKLGTHTGRKTGYLFSLLRGCIDLLSMMKAADHDCAHVARQYLKDGQAIAAVN